MFYIAALTKEIHTRPIVKVIGNTEYYVESFFNEEANVNLTDKIKQLIYTTNAIENFNRQLRKVTKAKSVFPTDDSLLQMLYLAMMDITKKWTGRRQDWGESHSQLEIFFADRIPG